MASLVPKAYTTDWPGVRTAPACAGRVFGTEEVIRFRPVLGCPMQDGPSSDSRERFRERSGVRDGEGPLKVEPSEVLRRSGHRQEQRATAQDRRGRDSDVSM